MSQDITFGQGGGITGNPGVTASVEKMPTQFNYISNFDFAKNELPELYTDQVNRYGNQTVAGFLQLVSAELPLTSDLVKWSEENRLHISGEGTLDASGQKISEDGHRYRKNQTLLLSNGTVEQRAIVTDVDPDGDGNAYIAKSYGAANLIAGGFADGETIKAFVFGSEFKKGTNGMEGSLQEGFSTKETSPIILKDHFKMIGSDMTNISWVGVHDESTGARKFLWYLESQNRTFKRYAEYLEMSMIESEDAKDGSAAADAGFKGTKGLFPNISEEGNVGSGTITDREDLENICKVFDKEAALQEYCIWQNRDFGFAFDRAMSELNYDAAQGASYGLFNNSSDMALKLGFKAVELGGYEFYRSPLKYLNDFTTRGTTGGVNAVFVPMAQLNVYDEINGASERRPALHIRYKKSATEDRKYKNWVLGSAGGARTSDEDAMSIHFLSERCLVAQGLNNYLIVK